MEDLARYAADHPDFCHPAAVRVPGHGTLPNLDGARPFELTADALASYRVETPKDPKALPEMLKLGPEAVAFYVSFRLAPAAWGVYVREAALRALQEEYHRIVWRDLGKYADRDVSAEAERIEYGLVLDYLLTHNRMHFLADRQAALWELQTGVAKYAPYQATWYAAPPKPVMHPEDVGNLEEALANLDAFRSYVNPAYTDSVTKLIEGRLDERNVQEWKAFFVGGRFAVEMANTFSRQPPGWKDFVKFLNRKTAVGSTNYVRIQYSYNPDLLERGQRELARRIADDEALLEGQPNPFKAPPPDLPSVYLL
ncbi:MAG: hypothetical protein ACT4OI_05935 [Methanobacteriota archaeon]